jgi:hypothetical protein
MKPHELNYKSLYNISKKTNSMLMIIDFFTDLRVFCITTYTPPSKSSTSPINYMECKGIDVTEFVQNRTEFVPVNLINTWNSMLQDNKDLNVELKFSDSNNWFIVK